MNDKNQEKNGVKGKGIDSSRIILDDAGRFDLSDEQLEEVSGGMRNDICRIQSDPRGCGMNM